MMKTDLTLAICLYNAEQFIEETLQCVLVQTVQSFYLLIVNDCSTDNSILIIQQFFKKNPRQYELVSFGENRGIGYARHFAERHVTTKYMMFLDADDLLYPHAIEKMYSKIVSDADLMAVGCHLEYIDDRGKKLGGGIHLGETTKEGFYLKASKAKLIFMPITSIYDRKLALSVGGYNIEGFPDGKPRYQDFCEDLDLWTRMSDLYVQKKAIVVIPEVLCQYRKTGQSLSSNTLHMFVKMRYVKSNLLKRREGIPEQTFIDFQNNISEKELRSIEKEVSAATYLRESVLAFKDRKFGEIIQKLALSIKSKPKYVWKKIQSNL